MGTDNTEVTVHKQVERFRDPRLKAKYSFQPTMLARFSKISERSQSKISKAKKRKRKTQQDKFKVELLRQDN